MPLSLPDLSSSLPVTLMTTNPSLSRSTPVFNHIFPNKLNYQSFSSFNNLGFTKLAQTKLRLSVEVKQRFQVRAGKGIVDDESDLTDWVNELSSGGRGRGRGRGRVDFNDGFSNRERESGNRGSFGGNSRGSGSRGSFGGNVRGRGTRGSFGGSSRGRGRFSGEDNFVSRRDNWSEYERSGGRFERFPSRRENGYDNGRGGGGGRGRFGGEVQRRNDGYSHDSDKGKGSWGAFYSSPEGTERYLRDTYREDDRFLSSRRDDRFVSNTRNDGFVSDRRDDRFDRGGRGRGRGGRGGGVSTSFNRSMGRESVPVAEEVDVEDFDVDEDDEEDEMKLMQNYKDLISDNEDNDDYEDDVVLEKEHSVSGLSRVSLEGNESYLSETRFDQCPVSPLSLKAVKDAGYEKMTIVQEATLPLILEGKDVLAKARTGTGKTVAFLLPSIEVVINSPPVSRNERWPPILVLVICPTRELASQAATEANKLLKYYPSVGVQVVIGGTRIATEQRRIQTNPCQILVATPGRLKDHILNTSGFANRVKGVKVLVLDEADHLLDMGFRKDIENIIASVPKQRQTLLFSATVPPEVRQICHIALKRDHEYINTVEEGSEETHTQVQQKHMIAPLDKQFSLLYTILKNHIAEDADYKVLVFCTTAMVTKLVADILGQLKLNVREIHSRKSQSNRTQVSDEFRKSKGLILVTSDVSARGVDYPDVTLVIQVGLPSDKSQYIHRLGRTGRKGKEGEGILLLAPWEEFFLSSVRDLPISKANLPLIHPDTKKKVERALSYVDMRTKESAYQAWLGYYNSNKTVARDKNRLIELANEFSRSMGLDIPPALSKLVLGKMGLKNIPGLRFK